VLEAIRAGKRLATVIAPVLRREATALFPNAKWGEAALYDPTEAKVALHDVEMTIARHRLTGRAAMVRRVKERSFTALRGSTVSSATF
jgi:hypothetical protein